MTPKSITLDAQLRGDPFSYSSSLAGGWAQSMFQGFWFTLRDGIPPSTTVDDADAVDQATSAASEITFQTTTNFTVDIPEDRTTTWPLGRLYWDLVGVDLAGKRHTLARGDIPIVGDITRSH